jgi:hypothetical protein
LANAITAFAVAQSLALAYALAGNSGNSIRSKKDGVTVAIAGAALVFCVAVWFCNHAQTALLTVPASTDASPMPAGPSLATIKCFLAATMVGRMLAIGGYAVFGIWLLRSTGQKSLPPG